ncbi:hypothetical protein ACFQ88_07935 [Paenibacillus sp. NPDC056579]|uniref:hypothetical protein n=1 Tax=unclassified Paenibacillus TaxID=185978 RepID=UPI001EF82E33|nr:hypothetical protein [Paenibacillus sp. H1-7]ULL14177.1 hypothetical protein DVH26_06800 [Paenibacillus sp. H1-7]
MIIALDNVLPAQGQLQELLASVEENGSESGLVYETYCQSRCVVAAYDKGRLVGLGRLADESGAGNHYEFTVLQDYKNRDIEAYMRKLLSIQRI